MKAVGLITNIDQGADSNGTPVADLLVCTVQYRLMDGSAQGTETFEVNVSARSNTQTKQAVQDAFAAKMNSLFASNPPTSSWLL